jgi:hypothetical protein
VAVAVSPVLFLLVALAGLRVAGRDLPAVADFGRFSGTPLLGLVGVFLMITFVGSLGEEAGWRAWLRAPGVAAPVQPVGGHRDPGAVVVLLARAAVLRDPVVSGLRPGRLRRYVPRPGLRAVVLTWLYNRSGGSLLLVVGWHGMYNFVGATHAAVTTPIATLIMVQGILLISLDLLTRRRGQPSVLGPPEPAGSSPRPPTAARR